MVTPSTHGSLFLLNLVTTSACPRAIKLEYEGIIAPHIGSFQGVLKTLLKDGLIDHIFGVAYVLFIDGQSVEIRGVMDQLIWPEILGLNKAVHLSRLEGHMSLGFFPFTGLLALYVHHLLLKPIR